MGRRLQRTPIEGDPHPELFGPDTAQRLIDLMWKRRPFIDNITDAEGVCEGPIAGYLVAAQKRAKKNMPAIDPNNVTPEALLGRAVLNGKTNKAVLARLQGLTLFHAAIANHRFRSIRSGVMGYATGQVAHCSRQGMKDLSDSLLDLAYGISASSEPVEIGFTGDLAATIESLADITAQEVGGARAVKQSPFIAAIALNDQKRKASYWADGFRTVCHYDERFAGDPLRILYPITNIRHTIDTLNLQDYFPEDLIETAIGMQNGQDVPFAEV